MYRTLDFSPQSRRYCISLVWDLTNSLVVWFLNGLVSMALLSYSHSTITRLLSMLDTLRNMPVW